MQPVQTKIILPGWSAVKWGCHIMRHKLFFLFPTVAKAEMPTLNALFFKVGKYNCLLTGKFFPKLIAFWTF